MTIVGYEPSIIMSGEMVEVDVSKQPTRPFPETYGDWVNLSEDIKKADPESIHTVNEKMTTILHNIGDVDGAKRWLAEKAGELDVK